MERKLCLSEKQAKTVLDMDEVCYGEGIGPDTSELLCYIREEYPKLAKSYQFLYKDLTSDCGDYPKD